MKNRTNRPRSPLCDDEWGRRARPRFALRVLPLSDCKRRVNISSCQNRSPPLQRPKEARNERAMAYPAKSLQGGLLLFPSSMPDTRHESSDQPSR